MGVAYSPTVANIYMSVTLRRFLRTQRTKPLLMVRYIDDILMIWTDSETELKEFLTDINQFNPALKYTHQYSPSTVDFLDLTIYKGPSFLITNVLDTKTYQKPHNLYQYLHYSSSHQKAVFKSIISGELTRYVRTNTSEVNYKAIKHLFKLRLLSRGYPQRLIETVSASVLYSDRQKISNSTTQVLSTLIQVSTTTAVQVPKTYRTRKLPPFTECSTCTKIQPFKTQHTCK